MGQSGNNQADNLPQFGYATSLQSFKILVEGWGVPTSQLCVFLLTFHLPTPTTPSTSMHASCDTLIKFASHNHIWFMIIIFKRTYIYQNYTGATYTSIRSTVNHHKECQPSTFNIIVINQTIITCVHMIYVENT